jgi:hypothetical protein
MVQTVFRWTRERLPAECLSRDGAEETANYANHAKGRTARTALGQAQPAFLARPPHGDSPGTGGWSRIPDLFAYLAYFAVSPANAGL